MRDLSKLTIALLTGYLLVLVSVDSRCAADDLFRDQIAPLLQRRCLNCHNDRQREGEFSMQTSASAKADGYIEPGDAENSYLVELITPVDGIAAMPHEGEPLSAKEIELIRNWIDRGAFWPANLQLEELVAGDFDWWSFQPIARPAVPAIEDDWITNPVDAFVLRKLQERGLQPAPRADRRTLIRRLTFDLTGLPPTPAEVEQFVGSQDPLAYEKLVDRLLASDRYGERWARHWLDVVKYADTCGYDKDKLRPHAWPYRDYVIRSFNQDKPYGRFIQEQVAGDVLFPDDPDGIAGTGFIAAGPWDFIGHVEVAESKIDGQVARNLDRDDMVSNALNTFCSVTIQCARCHNHKFDPFTQRHYYGLQAIFAAVDRADRPFDADPKIAAQRRQRQTALDQRQQELAELQQQLETAGGDQLEELRTTVRSLQQKQGLRRPPEYGYHSANSDTADTQKWVAVSLPQPTEISAVVLHACHDDFAGIGAGFGFPVRFHIEAQAAGDSENQEWISIADQTSEDFANPGLASVKFDCDLGQIKRVRVTATQLAPRKDDFNFALSELQLLDRQGRPIELDSAVSVTALDSIEAPVRWTKSNLIDGKWPRAGSERIADQLREAEQELQAFLRGLKSDSFREQRRKLVTELESIRDQVKELPSPQLIYAAATEFKPQGQFKPTGGKPRPIHLLHRGEVTQPGPAVAPGLLPLAPGDCSLDPALSEGDRRAALARWLTREDHPLVWRSIVNRIWLYHFGRGIVATPNDFGRMGSLPTHPELLDWLASEFLVQGQSFKHLHRLIVTSSVYRQSAEHNLHHAAIDGSNQFLWKMDRRRLEAEEIRDSILAVSGALDLTMGGPGFYLFEIERPEHSPHYQYHLFDPADPSSHRRSIYRFIVRSQPDPWMTTLDCADSSQSTPTRNETLTSLQALSLLNSQFNLVMAEQFAERLRRDADSIDDQVQLAMQLVAQRSPTAAERQDLIAYANEHGLANLCRFLFNLNEFVYLD